MSCAPNEDFSGIIACLKSIQSDIRESSRLEQTISYFIRELRAKLVNLDTHLTRVFDSEYLCEYAIETVLTGERVEIPAHHYSDISKDAFNLSKPFSYTTEQAYKDLVIFFRTNPHVLAHVVLSWDKTYPLQTTTAQTATPVRPMYQAPLPHMLSPVADELLPGLSYQRMLALFSRALIVDVLCAGLPPTTDRAAALFAVEPFGPPLPGHSRPPALSFLLSLLQRAPLLPNSGATLTNTTHFPTLSLSPTSVPQAMLTSGLRVLLRPLATAARSALAWTVDHSPQVLDIDWFALVNAIVTFCPPQNEHAATATAPSSAAAAPSTGVLGVTVAGTGATLGTSSSSDGDVPPTSPCSLLFLPALLTAAHTASLPIATPATLWSFVAHTIQSLLSLPTPSELAILATRTIPSRTPIARLALQHDQTLSSAFEEPLPVLSAASSTNPEEPMLDPLGALAQSSSPAPMPTSSAPTPLSLLASATPRASPERTIDPSLLSRPLLTAQVHATLTSMLVSPSGVPSQAHTPAAPSATHAQALHTLFFSESTDFITPLSHLSSLDPALAPSSTTDADITSRLLPFCPSAALAYTRMVTPAITAPELCGLLDPSPVSGTARRALHLTAFTLTLLTRLACAAVLVCVDASEEHGGPVAALSLPRLSTFLSALESMLTQHVQTLPTTLPASTQSNTISPSLAHSLSLSTHTPATTPASALSPLPGTPVVSPPISPVSARSPSATNTNVHTTPTHAHTAVAGFFTLARALLPPLISHFTSLHTLATQADLTPAVPADAAPPPLAPVALPLNALYTLHHVAAQALARATHPVDELKCTPSPEGDTVFNTTNADDAAAAAYAVRDTNLKGDVDVSGGAGLDVDGVGIGGAVVPTTATADIPSTILTQLRTILASLPTPASLVAPAAPHHGCRYLLLDVGVGALALAQSAIARFAAAEGALWELWTKQGLPVLPTGIPTPLPASWLPVLRTCSSVLVGALTHMPAVDTLPRLTSTASPHPLLALLAQAIAALRAQHRASSASPLLEAASALAHYLPQPYHTQPLAFLQPVAALTRARLAALTASDVQGVLVGAQQHLSLVTDALTQRQRVAADGCHNMQIRRLLAALTPKLLSLHQYIKANVALPASHTLGHDRVRRIARAATELSATRVLALEREIDANAVLIPPLTTATTNASAHANTSTNAATNTATGAGAGMSSPATVTGGTGSSTASVMAPATAAALAGLHPIAVAELRKPALLAFTSLPAQGVLAQLFPSCGGVFPVAPAQDQYTCTECVRKMEHRARVVRSFVTKYASDAALLRSLAGIPSTGTARRVFEPADLLAHGGGGLSSGVAGLVGPLSLADPATASAVTDYVLAHTHALLLVTCPTADARLSADMAFLRRVFPTFDSLQRYIAQPQNALADAHLIAPILAAHVAANTPPASSPDEPSAASTFVTALNAHLSSLGPPPAPSTAATPYLGAATLDLCVSNLHGALALHSARARLRALTALRGTLTAALQCTPVCALDAAFAGGVDAPCVALMREPTDPESISTALSSIAASASAVAATSSSTSTSAFATPTTTSTFSHPAVPAAWLVWAQRTGLIPTHISELEGLQTCPVGALHTLCESYVDYAGVCARSEHSGGQAVGTVVTEYFPTHTNTHTSSPTTSTTSATGNGSGISTSSISARLPVLSGVGIGAGSGGHGQWGWLRVSGRWRVDEHVFNYGYSLPDDIVSQTALSCGAVHPTLLSHKEYVPVRGRSGVGADEHMACLCYILLTAQPLHLPSLLTFTKLTMPNTGAAKAFMDVCVALRALQGTADRLRAAANALNRAVSNMSK